MAGDACFRRVKRLLFGPFLAKPPSPPVDVVVVPRFDGFDVKWRPGVATSEYNLDRFEVEMAPTSPELLELLGESGSTMHVQFYRGVDSRCAIDRLQPTQAFALRVRCVNRAGVSCWVGADCETCAVPIGCGGAGPNGSYAWDQTPTHVEITIPCPSTLLKPRDVELSVKPKHLQIKFTGEESIGSGELYGTVLCQPGDFEWELRDSARGDSAGHRELFLSLEKDTRGGAGVSYHPEDQWERVFLKKGHAKIDRRHMRWLRDGEWRPPKDARCADEVASALPGMNFSEENQQTVKGRDGELDDWGRDWGGKKKKKSSTF